MNPTDSITIVLAGQPYVVHPFTVGQLEELHVGVVLPNSPDPKEEVRSLWRRNIDVLAAALAEDHPHMQRPQILKMRLGNVKEVNREVNKILRFAGIIDDEKASSGESQPGEAQAAA